MSRIKPLSDADLVRLDDFLLSENVPDVGMDLPTLEGWLTALVIGPRMVMPSAWLPWVWDFEDGREDVSFASDEQAKDIIGIIMSWWNQIAQTFQQNPEAFEPAFNRRDEWGVFEWCEGFLKATELFDADDWITLWTENFDKDAEDGRIVSLVTPFMRLGTVQGLEAMSTEEEMQEWAGLVTPALIAIHQYWLARREYLEDEHAQSQTPLRRTTPKIGRNDPCPCGSGKKYKRCCG